jgi:hypothetical protein
MSNESNAMTHGFTKRVDDLKLQIVKFFIGVHDDKNVYFPESK